MTPSGATAPLWRTSYGNFQRRKKSHRVLMVRGQEDITGPESVLISVRMCECFSWARLADRSRFWRTRGRNHSLLTLCVRFQERNARMEPNASTTMLRGQISPVTQVALSFGSRPSKPGLPRDNRRLPAALRLDRASLWWRTWPRN